MVNHWNGRRVTVMGLGRFGGGVGVVRWLARQGAQVTLTDHATPDELADSLAQLHDVAQESLHPITFHLGGHETSDFTDTELLVVNPAVRPDNRWVREALSHGVPITTEIGLFLDACPARVIGVTGSNGKSTTASMIASILRADGRKTWLGGNLGGSLLGELESMTEHDWAVLELSSFQITYLSEKGVRNLLPERPEGCFAQKVPDTFFAPPFFAPHIVVVTNCVPNHLDWHDTFENYAAAKRRLLEMQTSDGVAILGPTLADLPEWQAAVQGQLVLLARSPATGYPSQATGLTNAGKKEPVLFFPHDVENATLAAAAASAAGCSDETIERGLTSYVPLPGRLEPVGQCRGRRCINDTASTTPESTIAATIALPGSWILVGGGDKGSDFSAMLQELARSAHGVAFYGTVGPRLCKRFTELLQDHSTAAPPPHFALFTTLDEALEWSLTQSEPGESIVLSPGCSSHDQFTNFVERGEHFKRLVKG